MNRTLAFLLVPTLTNTIPQRARVKCEYVSWWNRQRNEWSMVPKVSHVYAGSRFAD